IPVRLRKCRHARRTSRRPLSRLCARQRRGRAHEASVDLRRARRNFVLMNRPAVCLGSLALVACVAQACSVDTAPTGLRATPPGNGPTIKWDLSHRPLPEVPLPNDVATFADPTSRTGLRINASLVAPTGIEQSARGGFDDMEGWGTSSPITVAFARGPKEDPTQAAIDLDAVRAAMQGDGHDFADDPVYLVNLTTGIPMVLDVGEGY